MDSVISEACNKETILQRDVYGHFSIIPGETFGTQSMVRFQ